MKRKFVCAAMVLLGLLSQAAMAASPAPRCKASLETEVDLHEEPDGNYLVPFVLDGKPVWFRLDTSSSVNVLSQAAVDRLQIKTALIGNRGNTVTVGGRPFTRIANLTTLSLGSHRYTPVIAGILPDNVQFPDEDVDGKPVIGELGTEVLTRTDFELHLAEKKLRLFDQNHCRGVGAYWTSDYAETTFARDAFGGIFIAMSIEGQRVETALSTQSSRTQIDTKVTREAFGFDETSPGIQRDGNGGGEYRAMSLRMPGFDIKDVPVRLRDSGSDCGIRQRIDSGSKAYGYGSCLLIYPMRLGRDVLQRMRLYVALKERKVYFTEVAAP